MTSASKEATEPEAGELVLPPDATVGLVADQLVEQARSEGVALTGEGGLLTGLVQRVLQRSLESEITDHLGYEPHAVEGRGSGNSRNGHHAKTVRTEIGDVRVEVPRDRKGAFEPVTVPVGQRRLSGLDQMVISLYAKGLTTGDIAGHLFEVYDQSVDRATISRITDGIVADMQAWQSRPLDSIYPVLLVDGIRIKIRDGTVTNRVVYVVMGINLDGARDILGLWVGPTGDAGPRSAPRPVAAGRRGDHREQRRSPRPPRRCRRSEHRRTDAPGDRGRLGCGLQGRHRRLSRLSCPRARPAPRRVRGHRAPVRPGGPTRPPRRHPDRRLVPRLRRCRSAARRDRVAGVRRGRPRRGRQSARRADGLDSRSVIDPDRAAAAGLRLRRPGRPGR